MSGEEKHLIKNNGGEFVKLWADQEELALSHSRIPTVYRHENSQITARLCIAQLEEDMSWCQKTSDFLC